MFYYFFALLLCSFLLLQFPARNLDETPSFTFDGYYEPISERSIPENLALETLFNGVQAAGKTARIVRLSNGFSRLLRGPEAVSVPFLGYGFFRYLKVGKDIYFHGRKGELLWKKEFHSYPTSAPSGAITRELTVTDWDVTKAFSTVISAFTLERSSEISGVVT